MDNRKTVGQERKYIEKKRRKNKVRKKMRRKMEEKELFTALTILKACTSLI